MIDLGRFEDIGYADVIQTGMSKEETERKLREIAKKLGIKIKIKHGEHPKGSVILDTRTGRCYTSELTPFTMGLLATSGVSVSD